MRQLAPAQCLIGRITTIVMLVLALVSGFGTSALLGPCMHSMDGDAHQTSHHAATAVLLSDQDVADRDDGGHKDSTSHDGCGGNCHVEATMLALGSAAHATAELVFDRFMVREKPPAPAFTMERPPNTPAIA